MNSRRVKTWLTEDEILAAIDRAHRKAERLILEERELRKECSELFGELEKIRFELMRLDLSKGKRDQLETRERVIQFDAADAKLKADVKARAYVRLKEKTIPHLGETLSAFRTGAMTGVLGEYRGVVVK